MGWLVKPIKSTLVLTSFALCFVTGHTFALSWQEVVSRSSGAVVHLEGLSADGRNRMGGTGFFYYL